MAWPNWNLLHLALRPVLFYHGREYPVTGAQRLKEYTEYDVKDAGMPLMCH